MMRTVDCKFSFVIDTNTVDEAKQLALQLATDLRKKLIGDLSLLSGITVELNGVPISHESATVIGSEQSGREPGDFAGYEYT